MRQIVNLNPQNTSIAGAFASGADHVYFLCDTTEGDYSATLPDCRAGMQTELVFKNIGTGFVTIYPTAGQYTDNTKFHKLNPWDCVSFVSDLKGRWILLDANARPSVSSATAPFQLRVGGDFVFRVDGGFIQAKGSPKIQYRSLEGYELQVVLTDGVHGKIQVRKAA